MILPLKMSNSDTVYFDAVSWKVFLVVYKQLSWSERYDNKENADWF